MKTFQTVLTVNADHIGTFSLRPGDVPPGEYEGTLTMPDNWPDEPMTIRLRPVARLLGSRDVEPPPA